MSHVIKIAGLICAAGSSRRMGQDKRLLRCGNHTVLETTARCLQLGGITPIIVVLESNSPCQTLPALKGTILVTNPLPERGMLSSIREGLLAIPEEAEAVAILPGDHPFVPPKAVKELVTTFNKNQPQLMVPRYAGKRGHPLFIARALFSEALACEDQYGLRQLLQRRKADLMEINLDYPDADHDLDIPEDLKRLEKK